jgi:hypothetical protein
MDLLVCHAWLYQKKCKSCKGIQDFGPSVARRNLLDAPYGTSIIGGVLPIPWTRNLGLDLAERPCPVPLAPNYCQMFAPRLSRDGAKLVDEAMFRRVVRMAFGPV